MLWLKVVVGIYYELCVLEWLHSCQVEAWPNIYSRFLFFLLKMYKEESFEFWISLFIFVCLSTHFLQKSYSFPSFPNFILLCNISDCCLVTCIAPSTLGSSKKPCVWKGGGGGRKHKSIWNYPYWAICVQCSFWAKMILSCLTSCNWAILFYEFLTLLLTEFLSVSQTLSNPYRCHSVVISYVLKLIHINSSVISHCITTSDKSRCIYFTFLEEKKNKWIQLDYAIENATNKSPQ